MKNQTDITHNPKVKYFGNFLSILLKEMGVYVCVCPWTLKSYEMSGAVLINCNTD